MTLSPARTLNALSGAPMENLHDAEMAAAMALGAHADIDGVNPAMDNLLRASFALGALRPFAERTGLEHDDLTTILGDFLADVRHLCDALGLEYGVLDGVAHGNYASEIGGYG